MTPTHRDLQAPELWERSLARSRLRRALAPRARREHKRRKGLSAAAAAATMAGPGAPMALAQFSGDVQAEVAAETTSTRAIEVREGGLPLQFGSQGELVAHVQKALQIPADGIFGGQTDTAVRQYQTGAGLQVGGIVGPATWAALFESGSAVGGSNVSPQVTERIEQKLEAAGRRIDAQAGLAAQESGPAGGSNADTAGGAGGGSTGDTAGGAGGSGEGSSGVPIGGGDADEAPAGGQTDTPSAGGGLEGTTPVNGACGSTLSLPVSGTVTSEFGPRWGRNHDGVDIAAPTGTPVRAAACGSVTVAGAQSGYGNIVCITHTNEFSTCYAHLSRSATSQGARVQQGQVIGYVGCTGSCTGPHLHFETRVNGQAQNPRGYMSGASVPGASARTAKATTTAGTARAKAGRTTTTRPAANAAVVNRSGRTVATKESLAARQATAMAAVGPTTPTAPPGTPEAMSGAAAPAEAAPPPEAPPVPAEAVPVPTEAAPVPVEPAPVPVETAPEPAAAAPAPAPAPVEA